MFDNLRADLRAASADRKLERGLWRVFLHMETPAIICYRFSHWVTEHQVPVVSQILGLVAGIFQRLVQIFVGVYISADAQIGPGLVIHTPYGIIVGATKIGANCTIQNGVVISSGTRSIGDNVYFGAGAKVLGDTKIGNNVVVVANSLVLTDVPDNTTVLGVPARIRLPGGRPKRFPWKTISPQPAKLQAQPVPEPQPKL